VATNLRSAKLSSGREKASGTYKVMQLMPSEGGDFNIASETLTSRTTALSKKAISIASHEQDKH
jgi:hypothetical protein